MLEGENSDRVRSLFSRRGVNSIQQRQSLQFPPFFLFFFAQMIVVVCYQVLRRCKKVKAVVIE